MSRGRFAGRAAVVTGASRGIGRSIAELLAAEGAMVVAAADEGVLLGEVVSEIAAAGGTARASVGDLADPEVVGASR